MAKENKYYFACTEVKPEYDPERDLRPVEDFGQLCLSEILSTGIVPPEGKESEYDDSVKEPAQILGQVRDVFQAIRIGHRMVANAQASADIDAAVASTASSQNVASPEASS